MKTTKLHSKIEWKVLYVIDGDMPVEWAGVTTDEAKYIVTSNLGNTYFVESDERFKDLTGFDPPDPDDNIVDVTGYCSCCGNEFLDYDLCTHREKAGDKFVFNKYCRDCCPGLEGSDGADV